MTKKEVADLLGKSERTVAQYAKDGLLSVTYIKGTTSDKADYDELEVLNLKERLAKGETLNRATARPIANIETNIAKVEPSPLPQASNIEGQSANVSMFLLSEEQFKTLLPTKEKESLSDLAVMPFLSFAQAARLFNVPEQHLRDAAKKGELKAVKQGRGQQVRAKDVLAWRDAKFEN